MAIVYVFCEEITFRRSSITMTGRFNFVIQKLCTPRTLFCTITRDTIERNEIGGCHCRGVFIFGSYILHAIRTQCGPSEAVVYYFRYLTAARLPACFPLHSVPTKFRHIRIYLFRSYGKIWERFSASSSAFNVRSESDSENNIDFIYTK